MTRTAVIVGLVGKSGFPLETLLPESGVAVESVNLVMGITVAFADAIEVGSDDVVVGGSVVVDMDGAFVFRVVIRCVARLVTGRTVVPFRL